LHALLEQYPPEALRYALLSAHYRQPLDWSEALIEQSIATLDRLYGTLRDLSAIQVSAYPAEVIAEIESALNDDLNTPAALAELANATNEARRILDQEAKLEYLKISITPLNQIELSIVKSNGAFLKSLGITTPSKIAAQNMLDANGLRQAIESVQANHKADLEQQKARLVGGGALLGLLQYDPEAWFKRGAEHVDASRVEGLIEARRAARTSRDFARADAIRDELAAMGVAIEDGPQGTRWKIAN